MRVLSKVFVTALAAAVLVTAPPVSAGVGGPEHRLVGLVNEVRELEGLRGVRIHPRLSRKAESRSRHMLSTGEVSHSGVLQGDAGEIVAAGSTLRAIVKAFAISPEHRRIMLDSGYHRVGVGVARGSGMKWVTLIFT